MLLAGVILLAIILPFMIWGKWFDEELSLEGARRWMLNAGGWAWAAGIALLVSDIVLPVPSTVVMSAIGLIYGWLLGGLIAAAGSMFSGMAAYFFCRWIGRPAALWIAGEEGLRRAEALFEKNGGWLVAMSRWAPVLPEAVACLAGIANMRRRVFLPALACGSLPLGFAFAAIGDLGNEDPVWAMALSAFVPLILWLAAARILRHSSSGAAGGLAHGKRIARKP